MPSTLSTVTVVPDDAAVAVATRAYPRPPTAIDCTRHPNISPSIFTAKGFADCAKAAAVDPVPNCPFALFPQASIPPLSNKAKDIVPPAAT
jgi:hypothetical protein